MKSIHRAIDPTAPTAPTAPLSRRLTDRAASVLVVCGLLLTLGLAGCSRHEPAGPAVAARVEEEVILVDDVRRAIEDRARRGMPVTDPVALLDTMIERELLLAKAREQGMDHDPEVVRATENLIIARYKAIHLHPSLRNAKVDDADIDARFAREEQAHTRPAKARLAILFLSAHPKMSEEKRAAVRHGMEEARSKALTGEDKGRGFGSLAVSASEDQATRYRGGDAGWLDAGVAYRWPEPVITCGFALEKGELSEVLETDEGFYLVKKLDGRPAAKVPLEQVSDRLRRELLTEERNRIEETFARDLRRDVSIEKNLEALAHLKVPAEAVRTAAVSQFPTLP